MSARWSTLDGSPTRVIAHRGASGLLPEHTLAGYALALEQGAEVIEPDLVISRDLDLIVRHDRGLSRSTDVASRSEFAARQRDGDWWVEEFDRADLAELRAIQPFAQRDHVHDGLYPIPSFADVLAWATATARQRGTPIKLYPELKHPAQFAANGRDPLPRFIEALLQVDSADVTIWVQGFEIEALRRVRAATGLPVFLLLDAQADGRRALDTHGDEVDGFGASKSLLCTADGRDSGFVAQAHAAGLVVHAWTYRDDMLPAGMGRVEDELEQAFAIGADAVFCDFPATALAFRAQWAAR